MAIDDKLFRIYEEAHAVTHKSRAFLARAVAEKKLAEFSYQRNNETHYHTADTINGYIGLLVDYNILTSELALTIQTQRVSRRGFDLTLGDNVESYASVNGFSIDRLRAAVRELLQRTPAQLPTPLTVYAVLQLPISSDRFTKALSVRAFQQRVNAAPKQKNVLLIQDVLRE